MSEWDDIMGSKAPSGDHTKESHTKYEHWFDKELRGMTRMDRTEASADKRAFEGKGNERTTRGGMQGRENPAPEFFERERGDSAAPGRVRTPFEARDEFPIDLFDRGDERSPSGGGYAHEEGAGAPRRGKTREQKKED